MAEAVADGERVANPSDDVVLPFQTVRSGATGRLVRLGASVDAILNRHAYPEPVSRTLGEALALTAMLGAALKFDGRLTLQTKTDGAIDLLVADFESPGKLRGYASFDAARVEALAAENGRMAPNGQQHGSLLGSGHLAMTIDQGPDMDRYQGIVALSGESLDSAALTYFRQSEQLPTFLRLSIARHYSAGENGSAGAWRWRAGGLIVQHLTAEGGSARPAASSDEDELALAGEDDDDWQRARLLAATVEDHELLDPMLSPERLLYRLFHEEGVRAYPALSLADACRCSREKVETFLKRFGSAEIADLREPDGGVTVTCEFCNTRYHFTADELE